MQPFFRLLPPALLLTACATPVQPVPAKAPEAFPAPYAETQAVASMDDAADDPAIWVHPSVSSDSLVLGTDKQAGLYVYDLTGKEVQFLPSGRLNNVDLRQGIETDNGLVDIAAATNRTDETVTVFTIDRQSGVVTESGRFPVNMTEPYGFCLGQDPELGLLMIVTYKTGATQIFSVPQGRTDEAELLSVLSFGGQLEGCVYDEDQSILFIGEEEAGLWRVSLEAGQETDREAVDLVNSGTGLVADVEGVSLWRGEGTSGYLVASAQEADRFVVYDRTAPNAHLGYFKIVSGNGIDAVSHTDGLDISSADFGPDMPVGLLVVQDDANTDPAAPQNYKLVNWQAVATWLEAAGSEN